MTAEQDADRRKALRGVIRSTAYDALLDRYNRPKADSLALLVADRVTEGVILYLREAAG